MRHEGLSVEGRDESLLCYRGDTFDTEVGFRGARVKPDEIKLFIDEGRVVFDLFLEFGPKNKVPIRLKLL